MTKFKIIVFSSDECDNCYSAGGGDCPQCDGK